MEKIIETVTDEFGENDKITRMFRKCYSDTLDKTVERLDDETTFVITGDIPAMWLRDSSAQLRPYLPAAARDPEIRNILLGLVERQFDYILRDTYANAFNRRADGAHWAEDETERNDWVWERKYEVDSLCYPVQTAYLLWRNTGCTGQFNETFAAGVRRILEVFRTEQYHEERSPYRFTRRDCAFTDTLSRDGKGALVKQGIGLTWSGFRPSDDACVYGYLIPSNMFACVTLGYIREIAENILGDIDLGREAGRLGNEIKEGIETYGITWKEGFGKIYAYETDGFGQYNLMDDANVPSLLSMSYLGYQGDREVMENTRRFILSEGNPYFYSGRKAEGIGSSHTPPRYIWPISLAAQGLTCGSRSEMRRIIGLLRDTDAGTDMMHEGFHADRPDNYTRGWFSWANAMFCELVMKYCGIDIMNTV